MWMDLRLALRRLLRTPGVTLAGALTLALGIGISAAVFSVVEATLMRQMPFPEPERLVMVWTRQKADVAGPNLLSGPDLLDLGDSVRSLRDAAAMGEVLVAPIAGTDPPNFARYGPVTANFFAVLGAEAQLGRLFEPEDGAPIDSNNTQPPPQSIVISHDYWQNTLGGRQDVLGLKLRHFNNHGLVVGVLPPDFRLILPAEAGIGDDLGADIDYWVPIRTNWLGSDRGLRLLKVAARLSSGSSLSDAQGELAALSTRLREEVPEYRESGFQLEAQPLSSQSSEHLRPLLALLGAAVGCVLLVACVNVAGLLLSRMTARRRELNVRSALGAGAGRLARMALAESVALALLGSAGGVTLAYGAMRLLIWLRPAGLPQAGELSLNPSVLAFSLAMGLLSALLAGGLPALKSARQGRRASLNVRQASASRGQRRAQDILAASQVALTLILLIGAGLTLRSFLWLQSVPLGFETERVLTADISTVAGGSADNSLQALLDWIERRRNLEHQLYLSLNEMPGLEAASAIFPVPLNGVYGRHAAFQVPGREDDPQMNGTAYFRNLWPGYFESVGIPLMQGRDFELRDDVPRDWLPYRDKTERRDEPTVIVDERLAQRLWPGESPLGKRLDYSTFGGRPDPATVVGVVPFVPQGHLLDPMPTIYIPRVYYRSQELALTVRVAEDTPDLRRRMTEMVHRHIPDSPVAWRPLGDYVEHAQAPARFVLTLLSSFAAAALLLASVGLYGALSLMVRQRTSEIGVRMALGARRSGILRLVLGRGLALAAGGLLAGVAASLAATRFLEGYLHQVSATDPLTFLATAALLLAVCMLACLLPAGKASSLAPTEALRNH